MAASVKRPIVSMISANDLCRILAQAPKITTAAPTLTIIFTYFSSLLVPVFEEDDIVYCFGFEYDD
jgi:hypothetical protein